MSTPRLGLDVGGTKILGVAVDPSDPAAPIAMRRVPTPSSVDALVEALVGVVAELRAEVGPSAIDAPIGVGIPGVVDRDGVLWGAPNLRFAVRQPVRQLFEDRLGAPVRFANDATCALWGESRVGAGRGVDDIVQVSLGTGIGGGVMVGGRLVEGRHGFAGEPGHMVVERDGVPCPCGRRGCWERYASGAGLEWLALARVEAGGARHILELAGGDASAIRGAHVTAAAREGDPDALAVWDEFAGWLASGLGSLANILDPELFIIGGGLVAQADLYLPRTRELLAAEMLGAAGRTSTRVEPAALGANSAAIGAALLTAG